MKLTPVLGILAFCCAFVHGAEVSFNRDIRPIFAERCFECHGPAKAKGGLRLDLESSATNVLKSGAIAIALGDARRSEVVRRIRAPSADDRMPPEESGKTPLSDKEVALIEKWIFAGAKWDRHWAFNPIRRPEVPAAIFPESARNPIDAFVQRELAAHGMKPGELANPRILDRRLAFDLAGLPPFVKSDSWEEKVDGYLAAPSFGERMAVWWLDLVRYADTEGYFYDSHRNIYPYRDYVIHAFNANKPFDRFTEEQIAGDLLPQTGPEEKIASGYNRLIMTTHETGVNEAEYRARYAADRVRNVSAVWLGLTIGCAQCHDHKFDPITSADFYRMAAFFADIKEEAIHREPEVFVGIDSPEYAKLVEKTEEARRMENSWSPEVKCNQVLMEQEVIATGKAPDYWPKSKRTGEIVGYIRRNAAGAATKAEQKDIARYFQRHYLVKQLRELGQVMQARQKFETNAEPSLITERGPVRTVRVLARGNWMDESGPQVLPGFPGFLNRPAKEEVMDRLDLAKWLVARENPLTARALANRLWQLFFGAGLVRTLDDLGAQGEAPSNPELLDYLASELLDSGWDVKHVVRLIVSSYTYQQTSATSPEAREKDPENRLFARQNRFPLPAEFLGDNVRSIAGLLSRTAHGRPVKSYLPADYLQNVDTLNEEPYEEDRGDQLYRRGVYMYRKRSFLHPAMSAFNASTREECLSQRAKSNSPRQALTMLNAPGFVETARAFAERMHDAGCDDAQRLKIGFQVALGRDPSEREQLILQQLLDGQRNTFAAKPVTAAQSIRTGQYRWPAHIEAIELAAWTDVARAILNLEETNTRY